MDKISYSDYTFSEKMIETYKKHLATALIAEYIKTNGVDNVDVASFVAAAEKGGESIKLIGYAGHLLSLPLTNGPEMVDLGLPSGLKWAKCNVGAEKESDYGLYFKFGQCEGHDGDNCNHDSSKSTFNTVDGVLTPECDAATVLLGEGYHMPTEDDVTELIDNTNQYIETIDGVYGVKFCKKSDENVYIFIPYSGRCNDANNAQGFKQQGASGWLWTRSFANYGFMSGPIALSLGNKSDATPNVNTTMMTNSLAIGMCVRPISE